MPCSSTLPGDPAGTGPPSFPNVPSPAAGSFPGFLEAVRSRGGKGTPLIGRELAVHSDGKSGWGEGELDIPVLTAPKSIVQGKQHKPAFNSSREPPVVKGFKEGTGSGPSSRLPAPRPQVSHHIQAWPPKGWLRARCKITPGCRPR